MFRVFFVITILLCSIVKSAYADPRIGKITATETLKAKAKKEKEATPYRKILRNQKTDSTPKEREIIKVAVVLPLSGRSSASGQSLKNALPLIEFLNEERKFNNDFNRKYDFKTILYDDACDKSRAERIANHIVSQKDIHFVIGHYCSSTSMIGARIYKGEGILQISPFSTGSSLTEQGFEHFFRLAGRNDRQAEEAGMRMTEFSSGRKIGIIYGSENYGRDLAKRVRNVLRRENIFPDIQIDLREERAYSEIARELINNNIKVVYYGGYYQTLIKILRAVDELGGKINFFSADSMQNRQFWEEAGDLASNVLFTLTYDYSRDVSEREKNQLARIRRQEERARERGNRASIQALSGRFAIKDRAFNLRARFMRQYFSYYKHFPDLYALQLYAAYQIIKAIALDPEGRSGLVTAKDYEGEGKDAVILSRYTSPQEWVIEVSIYIRDMGINPYSDYVGFETVVGAVNFNASGEWGNAKYHIYQWINEREDRTWLAETVDEEISKKFIGRVGDFTRIF